MLENRKLRPWVLSAHSLIDWLNVRKPRIRSIQIAVAEYIRSLHSDRQRPLPAAARSLFVGPIQVRLRNIPNKGLDLVGFADRDYAALLLHDLSISGLLGRIRECPGCGRWFFAENEKQKVCSDTCRVKCWQKTPVGRAKRAAYMRDWRATNRKLWEAKQHSRKLTRGRKLHVSLRKGE
jgi:hypothetical protein